MKHQILILSLFVCMSAGSIAQAEVDVNKSCFTSCCKLKNCAPKPISKPTTITKSGCYCLTQDICGQITIAADNVTLDLNCHEVNGNGADAAIASDGYYNVTVKNGTVSNHLVIKNRGVGIAPNRCGLAIANGTDIQLEDLNVINTNPVGMALTDCVGLNISGCDFSNNDQALLLSSCRNGKIACCAAYDNVNTNTTLESSAVVSCEFCDCIEFVDVDVCNNTKNIEAFNNFSDPRAGIFTLAFSSNISLERCKVNGNGTDLPLTKMTVLFTFMMSNCTMTDCQANNNSIQDGFFSAVLAAFSPDWVVRRVQANGNSITNLTLGTFDEFFVFVSLFCPGTILEKCQVNNNSLIGGAVVGTSNQNLEAYLVQSSDGSVMKDCQANGNESDASCFGMTIISNNIQITNCQANNNSAIQPIAGIVAVFGRNNIDIIDCQANNNSSQGLNSSLLGVAFGIAGIGGIGLTIEGCEANNTFCVEGNALGISAYPFIFADGTPALSGQNDIRIVNCVANGTNSGNAEAFGILLDGAQGIFSPPGGGANNVVIKCCQVFDTISSSTLGHLAAGIATRNNNNDVSIQDCQVYDTRANGNGDAAGISIDGTLRCAIEGCEAFNATAATGVADGIVLKGTTDNSTVRDSSAIGNQDSGFGNFSVPDNFFAGNYAENNFIDYNGIAATEVVFDKSTGVFSATPNSWSNIQAVV